MRRLQVALVGCCLALLGALTPPATAVSSAADPPFLPYIPRPNIVLVMVDDLSAEIADYMGEVGQLADGGVSFSNYFVSNSLCCPSRATLLTGKFPHNSKVKGNYWPKGGFGKFLNNDLDTNLGPYLSDAGYRTGLLGKYLNQYEPAGDTDGEAAPDYPAAYVPPGWDEWFSTGWGYQQFEYDAVDSVDGVTEVVPYKGSKEKNYLTDVLSERAGEFIERAAETPRQPFFLALTPFAVHSAKAKEDPQQPDAPRFPAAPRDRADSPDRPGTWDEPEFEDGDCGDPVDGGCNDVAFPDPSWGPFNVPITDAPNHMPTQPLSQAKLDDYEQDHLERVQAAQAVDDLLADVRADLADAGLADDTYIVFTSDNGFHLGQHAIESGKGMPYDHDVRVPLVVYPPGGTTPRTQAEIVQNTDLLPTLLELARTALPSDVDGASLVPLLDADSAAVAADTWRRAALIEYYGFQKRPKDEASKLDPDRETGSDHAPPYVALRTADYLYVDYSDLDGKNPKPGKAEYFDLEADPYQQVNIYKSLSGDERTALNAAANAYRDCDGAECWDAGVEVP